jgi:hypothetical protein
MHWNSEVLFFINYRKEDDIGGNIQAHSGVSKKIA